MSKCNNRSRFPITVTILTVIFLYLPLLLVAIASFNASKYGGQWTSFTFKWYAKLFHESAIWEALRNTMVIALISTVISTVLGTMSALALHRSKSKFRGVYYALVETPLVVPDILMGISMLLLFVTTIDVCRDLFGIELELGMTTIVIAHVTFCMCYVTMVILGRLQEFDTSLLEAAQDLGATGLYTFFKVTLPLITPGIIAGALFAFTLSIDDFVITFFVKGAGDTTLPIYIQSAMRRGTPAKINALSVIFLVMTFALVFFTQKLISSKPSKENKK